LISEHHFSIRWTARAAPHVTNAHVERRRQICEGLFERRDQAWVVRKERHELFFQSKHAGRISRGHCNTSTDGVFGMIYRYATMIRTDSGERRHRVARSSGEGDTRFLILFSYRTGGLITLTVLTLLFCRRRFTRGSNVSELIPRESSSEISVICGSLCTSSERVQGITRANVDIVPRNRWSSPALFIKIIRSDNLPLRTSP
jgi:hypothetical protein